ncbi:MAG TPA: PP2C family serine/threonine-protein phosphatase [Myxococcaceae bacterium]|nr:PP2C family serine/threonine-protein phosphatase [Myxococcaceae bacterium]
MPTTSGEPLVGGRRVIGARHLREGRPCQDALLFEQRAGVVVLAVADGHGSSPRGGEGAELAVRTAVELLFEFYEALDPERRAKPERVLELAREPLRRKLAQEWARRVRESAGEPPSGQDVLREHGTTLLAALVAPELMLFAQLGDGDLLVTFQDGHVERGVEADPLSFADETASLCLPQAWLSMRVAVWPRSAEELLLLLSTDGCANSYQSNEAFERIGPDLLAWVHERGLSRVCAELDEWLPDLSRRGSGDDITVGMIQVPPAPMAAEAANAQAARADAGDGGDDATIR